MGTVRASGQAPREDQAGAAAADSRATATPGSDAADIELLVAGCRRGEPQAQTEIYRRFRHQIAGHLYRLLGGSDDLEDALQDTFIEAFRSVGRFRGEARFSTWLHGVAVHIALRRLRRRGRHAAAADRTAPPPAAEPMQSRTLEARRRLARVYAILDELPPKKRVVFVLHEIEGRALKEIAEMLGVPQITARTRLHYARKDFYARAAEDPLFEGMTPREEPR